MKQELIFNNGYNNYNANKHYFRTNKKKQLILQK